MRRAIGLWPSALQLTGLVGVVVAVAALTTVWVGVLVASAFLAGVGYLMEADR